MESPRPEFHVPGAYLFDSNLASNQYPSLPARALGADVFRPPADLARSTGSLFSDMSITTTSATNSHEYASLTAKRKRPVQDWSRESTPAAGEYTLAGQIDVDGTQSSQGIDESAYYSDVDYRRQLGPSQDSHISHTAGEVGPAGERWTVLHALGSVVGKVWSFCTAGAFRGFHAGGGDGYDWETGKPTGQPTGQQERPADASAETDDDAGLQCGGRTSVGAAGRGSSGRNSSRVPGRIGSAGTPPPRRAGKRRQVGPSRDELGRNWVMVDSGQRGGVSGRTSRASSSATMVGPHSALAIAGSRTPDRRSGQYRTSKSAAATPGTAASSRRINTPISRLGGPGTPATASAHSRRQQRVSHAGSPGLAGLATREPASFASPRASTPLGGRRATTAGVFQTSCSPGGASRIPVPIPSVEQQVHNPFARMTTSSSSSRPSSSLGQRSNSALGQRPGSAMSQSHSHSHSHSPGHRRSYSARVGSDAAGRDGGRQKSPKKTGPLESFKESPRLTEEAKRLAAQKMVAERDADEKMEALNYTLQMMIRQGREALGTTFEVDVGDGDGDGDGVGDGDGDDGDDLWTDDL